MSAARPVVQAPGRGFTLIEMVVVVSIVGILATAALPLAELGLRRAKEMELRRSLRTLREAIDAHKRAADAGLIKLPADASGYPTSLEVLVSGVEAAPPPAQAASGTAAPAAATGKRLYFLRRLPRDPMADATAPAAQTWGQRSYDSPPDAPRAGRDVYDVYSQSNRLGLDGTPYRQW